MFARSARAGRTASLIALLGVALLVLRVSPARAARERSGSIDVFLVLDESGSMKPIFSKVTAFVADALVQGYLEPEDYLCVIGFSSEARIRVSQRLSSEAERENLAEMVGTLNVVPQGYTDFGRALEEALRQLERLSHPSHQQVVLILTDGVNHPPRDSPYFAPVQPDRPHRPAGSSGMPPTSGFNDRFLAQVESLSKKGFRTHVVGIGTLTDARKLGEALATDYTLLKAFDAAELEKGLARFWDDTINLKGLSGPEEPCLPGEEMTLLARLASTSDQEREVQVSGVAVSEVRRVFGGSTPEDLGATAAVAESRWTFSPRQERELVVKVGLPPEFPAGDFAATLKFDQASAVRFYPPEASFTFHVPSFWERHGFALAGSAIGLIFSGTGFTFYRRRPIPVTMVVDGEAQTLRPVPFRIQGHASVGGGASDRFRLVGLPQKVAVLERRSVTSFALLSSKPDLVPTLPEYALGEAIEVRIAEGALERKVVRFVRWRKKPGAVKTRPVPAAPKPTAGGGVDFR
jgi:Mg-chelatase subunit ChlD